MTLPQLRKLLEYIQRHCAQEGWTSSQSAGRPLQPDTINLYEVVAWVVKPATRVAVDGESCSLMELLAHGRQVPSWFVSHWWGESVRDFVHCLQQHRQDRGLPPDAPYWVCAYANNQWNLSESITGDLEQTSFHKAMKKARGTVTVLDHSATTYNRIWCGFEIFVSLTARRQEDEHYYYDIYTINGEGAAVGLTDGPATPDVEGTDGKPWLQMRNKFDRERAFPIATAMKALGFQIQSSAASQALDRRRILNKVSCSIGSLDAEPPEEHPLYSLVNRLLRGRFAMAVWRIAFESGHAQIAELSDAVSESGLGKVHFELTDCTDLRTKLDLLVRALPRDEASERLQLNLCHTDLGPEGARTLSAGFSQLQQMKCLALFMFGDDIGPEGAEALGRGVGRMRQLSDLSLFLFSNRIGAEGVEALVLGLRELQQLDRLTLNLDDNSIGALGAQVLGFSLQHLGNLRHLHLSLKRNDINGDGAKALIAGLSRLPLLSSLHLELEQNCLGDGDGGDALCSADFGRLRGLSRFSLNLKANTFRDDCINDLAGVFGRLVQSSCLEMDLQVDAFNRTAFDKYRIAGA